MSLTHLPIVPTSILRRHHVHRPLDHRFRACARLLQSIWRSGQGLGMGSHTGRSGTKYRLGSRLAPRAAAAGGNFITPDVAQLARREAAYREPGALIDEERLFTNLLSSMPLCFNLFGPLKLDLDLATRFLSGLCPKLGNITVRAILFEHAPARGNQSLTGDHTAWDAFIIYSRPSGEHGFIAVECKYSERAGDGKRDLSPRYEEIAEQSKLYRVSPPTIASDPTLQQLYREHLMAQAYVPLSQFSEGHFAIIAPALNRPVQRAIDRYHGRLADGEGLPFLSWTLEEMVDRFGQVGAPDYARLLHERYCDWDRLHQELDAAFAVAGRLPRAANRPIAQRDPKLLPDRTGRGASR